MCRIKIPNPMQIPKDPENTWMEIFELIENVLENERLWSDLREYERGYIQAIKDIKEIIET